MIFIAYILIAAAALTMVYFGYQQGTSQFYMSVFSAAIVGYCIYLDFKKRHEKKETKKKEKTQKTGSRSNISKIAHKSTKDQHLNK